MPHDNKDTYLNLTLGTVIYEYTNSGSRVVWWT